MVTDQLRLAISQSIQQGVDRKTLIESLQKQGFNLPDILDGLAVASNASQIHLAASPTVLATSTSLANPATVSSTATPPIPQKQLAFSATHTIAQAWKMVKANLWSAVGFGLVFCALSYGVDKLMDTLFYSLGYPFTILISILSLVISMVLDLISTQFALDFARNATWNGTILTKPLKYFISYCIGTFLGVAIIIGGLVMGIIPGILWSIDFFFIDFELIQGTKPLTALKKSKMLMKDHRRSLALLVLYLIGIVVAGLLALVVGLLVALPIIFITPALAYLALEREYTERTSSPEAVPRLSIPQRIALVIGSIVLGCYLLYSIFPSPWYYIGTHLYFTKARTPSVYEVPIMHQIPQIGAQANTSMTFSYQGVMFKSPWAGNPKQMIVKHALALIYPDGRQIDLLNDPTSQPLVNELLQGQPDEIARMKKFWGNDTISSDYAFMLTVLSTNPDQSTPFISPDKAVELPILLTLKNAMLTAVSGTKDPQQFYTFVTDKLKGFIYPRDIPNHTGFVIDFYDQSQHHHSIIVATSHPQLSDVDFVLGTLSVTASDQTTIPSTMSVTPTVPLASPTFSPVKTFPLATKSAMTTPSH